MNDVYREALEGTLRSSPDGNPGLFNIVNNGEVPLSAFAVSDAGVQWGYDPQTGDFRPGFPGYSLGCDEELDMSSIEDGRAFVLVSAFSGAFVAAFKRGHQQTPNTVVVKCTDLCRPGEIGPLPQASPTRLIPLDSPRVLVGCGALADGKMLTREQFWRLSSSSYCLAPHEERTVTVTESAGMESTSSDLLTIASSVGLSASGGWGPVSASISATLSVSTSHMQQVTLMSDRTTLTSSLVKNDEDAPAAVFVWELVDVVTVFASTGEPVATMESQIQPSLVAPPHDALAAGNATPSLSWQAITAAE